MRRQACERRSLSACEHLNSYARSRSVGVSCLPTAEVRISFPLDQGVIIEYITLGNTVIL